jgi:hypothetical protein
MDTIIISTVQVGESFGSAFVCEENGEVKMCKLATQKYLQGLVNAKDPIQLLLNVKSRVSLSVS